MNLVRDIIPEPFPYEISRLPDFSWPYDIVRETHNIDLSEYRVPLFWTIGSCWDETASYYQFAVYLESSRCLVEMSDVLDHYYLSRNSGFFPQVALGRALRAWCLRTREELGITTLEHLR
jgi:hypothetical protein